ncbi:MAG: O-antigen ligase family protein [Woeseiaceae bacterium]
MPIEASDQNQITVILILATLLFVVASALPQKVATIALLVLVPYQSIETRFGTSSVVLAFVIFIAFLLKGEQVRLPMLPQILFLFLWYLISMSLMDPSTYMQHAIYVFTLLSAFLVFWLCYDLTQRFEKASSIVDVFIVMNVVVVIYCTIQLLIGPGERLILFGIEEINMTRVRADGRLTGPFESAEITAQFLVLMQFLILHQFWYAGSAGYKRILVALGTTNFAFLVATGSRGEFLVLIGGLLIYLWLFRRRLGVMRALGLAVGGALALTATALIVINFTQFGGLFERLQDTEFNEQGIPDTRQAVWPPTWREIVKSPFKGHGPRLRFHNEHRGQRYEEHDYIGYPHNLYLFLLYTVGIPGLILFLLFLFTILTRCWRSMSRPNAPPYYADLARTGVIVIFLFIVDGIKIEQMRLNLADYWHFFFGLCGVLLAACYQIDEQLSIAAKQENDQRLESDRGTTRSSSERPEFSENRMRLRTVARIDKVRDR